MYISKSTQTVRLFTHTVIVQLETGIVNTVMHYTTGLTLKEAKKSRLIILKNGIHIPNIFKRLTRRSINGKTFHVYLGLNTYYNRFYVY